MFSNQRTLYNKKNYINLDMCDTIDACADLNGAALKLYIYLCGKDNYEEYLYSPSFFCMQCGVSKTSEKNAFYELMTKGYITKNENDVYIFTPNKN